MSTVGYGVGANVGFASEGTPGTGEDATFWPIFTAATVKGQRPVVDSASITGDRSIAKRLAGVRSGAGDITMEPDGLNIGLPLYYLNGNASGALTSAAVPRISSAPTGSATGSGATIPTGTYRYKVAAVYQKTIDSSLHIMSASSELSGVAVTLGQQVDLAFTDPTTLTPPSGYTYAGTMVYRTAAGGGANSETFLHYKSGTGASYSDVGSGYSGSGSGSVPVSGTVYEHKFLKAFASGENPLPAFSTTVIKDNDYAERFLLCRMDKFELSVGDGNQPVTAKFSLLARDFERIANPTPSITNLRKMMSWQTMVAVSGTWEPTAEKLTLTVENGCQLLPGLSGQPRMRDVGYGMRKVSGELGRGFEDHTYWDIMRAGSRFSLRSYLSGQPIVETGCDVTIGAVVATPFRYSMTVDAYNCSLSEAGADVSGPGRMVESVKFGCEVDESAGTDMAIRLYNQVSSYS